MENEEKNSEEGQAPSQANDDVLKIEFMGQEFEATPEGIGRYNAARKVFEQTFGRQSQELGTLRKELPHVKKLGVGGSTSRAALFKEVAQLADEGNSDEALKRMANYIQQREVEIESREIEAKFKRDYESARPDIFEVLDKDLAWDHVFSNYRDALYHEEDPVGFVDRILSPKASKLKEKIGGSNPKRDLSAESFTSLGAGQSSPAKKQVKQDANNSDNQGLSWDDFGKSSDF